MIRVIVADPPWAPRDKLPGKGRGAAKQYPVMATSQICGYLPMLELQGDVRIADDALLVLWRLASMQTDALDVARAWGFRVVSELVWSKLTASGKQHFGMGRTVRASHEAALICVRGRVSRVIRRAWARAVRAQAARWMAANRKPTRSEIMIHAAVAAYAYGVFAGASYAAAVELGSYDSPLLAAALWLIALPAMAGFWLACRLLHRAEPPIPVARIASDRGARS